MNIIRNFFEDNDGVGVVEIILILVVKCTKILSVYRVYCV